MRGKAHKYALGKARMSKNILLTGAPGCGKTTLIRRALARLPWPAGGFYTQELRSGGVRRGFIMMTLDGEEAVLAHIDYAGPPRVGRYGVDVAALEAVGVASIRRALAGAVLVIIDEIGPMELLSPAFCAAVQEALDSPHAVLGTIVQRAHPFADAIKARPDVTVIPVTPANRDRLLEEVLALVTAALDSPGSATP
jgi:nucleoside-triphosphatase